MGSQEEVVEARSVLQLVQVVRKPGDVPGQSKVRLHVGRCYVRVQRRVDHSQDRQQQAEQLQHSIQIGPAGTSHLISFGTVWQSWRPSKQARHHHRCADGRDVQLLLQVGWVGRAGGLAPQS